MGASSSSSESHPVDLTPSAFKNLQGPFANVLGSLLGLQSQTYTTGQPNGTSSTGTAGNTGTQGTGSNPFAPQSNTAATKNPHAQDVMNGVRQGQGQGTGGQGGQTQTNYSMTDANGDGVVDGNDLLAGLPHYTGDLAAPITSNEQAILDQLMGTTGQQSGSSTTPGQQGSLSQQYLNGIIQGGDIPQGMTPEQLAQYAQQLGVGSSGYSATDNNPFVQAAITAVTRPILNDLQEQLTRVLPGRFTAAGQFINPHGSSAFDRAAALASTGAANAITDAGSTIAYNAFNDERQRQFQAQESGATREAAAIQSKQQEEAAQLEAERQRQQEAALQAPGVSKQEIDNLLSNLTAQGLPRLIQQQGIDTGVEQFNNQVNSLLSALGITAGVTRPVVGNTSSSSSGGIQLK